MELVAQQTDALRGPMDRPTEWPSQLAHRRAQWTGTRKGTIITGPQAGPL